MNTQQTHVRKALVVDDEPKWRKAGCLALQEIGFDPFPSETAQEAIDRLYRDNNKEVKLILLDYDLTESDSPAPKAFGIDILRKLNDSGRTDVRVVLYSSTLSEEKFDKVRSLDPDCFKNLEAIRQHPSCGGDYINKINYPDPAQSLAKTVATLKADLQRLTNVMRLLQAPEFEGKVYDKVKILKSRIHQSFAIITRIKVGWDRDEWSFKDPQGAIVALLTEALDAGSPWVETKDIKTRLAGAKLHSISDSRATELRVRDVFTEQLSLKSTARPLENRDITVEPMVFVKMLNADTNNYSRPLRDGLLKRLGKSRSAISFSTLREAIEAAISQEDFRKCSAAVLEKLRNTKSDSRIGDPASEPKLPKLPLRAERLLAKQSLNDGERRLLNWLTVRAAYPGLLSSPLECYHPAWCTLIAVAQLKKSSYRLDPSYSPTEPEEVRRKRIGDKQY